MMYESLVKTSLGDAGCKGINTNISMLPSYNDNGKMLATRLGRILFTMVTILI